MACSWCDFLQRQVQIAERGLALLRQERSFRHRAAAVLECGETSTSAGFDQAIVNAEGLLTRSYWNIDTHRRRYHPVEETTPEQDKKATETT
jgi:hypothetical protein